MTTDYLEQSRQREEARPAIERARDQANKSDYQPSNDIIRSKAQTLTALATAEALTRIAVALERVAREIDEDADAIRSARTTD